MKLRKKNSATNLAIIIFLKVTINLTKNGKIVDIKKHLEVGTD